MMEAVSENALKAILIGLSQLEQQTKINIEDTIRSASEKGSIRTNAAALAKAMHKAGLCGSRLEVLEEWLKIANDSDEFAEIRMAK